MIPRSKLFAYQERMSKKMNECGQLAAFVRMGLGKTISTLTALVDAGSPKTLVVAPARVVETGVWPKEAARWEHTAKLRVQSLEGTPAQRFIRLSHHSDIDLISYELFPWLTDTVDVNERYSAIVWDELSKMKTAGSIRFKRMRNRAMDIPIRYGLTGTPLGNHLIDLWAEMYAVAGEKPLGPSKALFLAKYFNAIPINNFGAKIFEPIHGAHELIFDKIKPWAFSLEPSDAPPLPAVNINRIEVKLPKKIGDMAEELARELITELDSGKELIALSGATRMQKIRQMSGGAVYHNEGNTWEGVHEAKLDALEEIVDGAEGESLLIFYWYKHEKERIQKRFPQAKSADDKGAVDAWNNGEIELLLAHPASAGHGLNLQFGGSTLVWFTLPWSWEMFSQSNGRLARHGQRAPFVMAHILVGGDVDEAVLQMLRRKEELEATLIKTVRI